MTIIDLTSGIYDSLGQTGITIGNIQSWLYNNIGRLNIEIDTNFSGVSGEIVPEMTIDQAAILNLLYLEFWYGRQARANLGANGYEVLSVTEGDSTVRVTNKTDLSKQYFSTQKGARSEINELVALYRLNRANPMQSVSNDEAWFFYPRY